VRCVLFACVRVCGGGYVLVLVYDLELVHMYPGTT